MFKMFEKFIVVIFNSHFLLVSVFLFQFVNPSSATIPRIWPNDQLIINFSKLARRNTGRREPCLQYSKIIEEGRAASPHFTFGYFLSISQREVSADVIQNSAVGNITDGTKTKTVRCLFFLMPFPILYILNCLQSSLTLHFAKFVWLLKRLQRLIQEWQKSPAGTRQTYDRN